MKSIKTVSGLLFPTLLLVAGCSTKPPACTDPQTLDTTKALVIEKTVEAVMPFVNLARRSAGKAEAGGLADLETVGPEELMARFVSGLKVEWLDVVNDGYRADASKQLCKGTLKITTIAGETFSRQTAFSTQRTENKGGFVLEVELLQPFIASASMAGLRYQQANAKPPGENAPPAAVGSAAPSAPTAASAPSAPSAPPGNFVGSYAGTGEGAVRVEIGEAGADGTRVVQISTTSQGPAGAQCGGQADGTGTVAGEVMTVNAGFGDMRCEITLASKGEGRLAVSEGKGCSQFHGAACSFDADVSRRK